MCVGTKKASEWVLPAMSLTLKHVSLGMEGAPFITENEYWEAVSDGCEALKVNVPSITSDELCLFRREFARTFPFCKCGIRAQEVEDNLESAVALFGKRINASRAAPPSQKASPSLFPIPPIMTSELLQDPYEAFDSKFMGGMERFIRLHELLGSGVEMDARDELALQNSIAQGVILHLQLYGVTPF